MSTSNSLQRRGISLLLIPVLPLLLLGAIKYRQSRQPRVLPPHARIVLGLQFSPDGKLLASSGPDTVNVQNLVTNTLEYSHKQPRSLFALQLIAFSPDGGKLAVTQTSSLALWDLPRGKFTVLPQAPGQKPFGIMRMVYRANELVLCGGYSGELEAPKPVIRIKRLNIKMESPARCPSALLILLVATCLKTANCF